ncbi:MAG: SDR family oxidoreductase [Ignavibacteria bacterium]|nr:SDR family oxidoreductase [Ignavibacteria bacterium]
MKNKIIIITGASSGVGRALAEGVLQRGGHLVMLTRDAEKTEAVRAELKAKTKSDKIDFIQADFDSFESVRKAAEKFKSKYDRLDILINNAATTNADFLKTENGIELTFAVNHLAPFLLTNLLLDTIKKSAPARIINVASNAHIKIDFDNLNGEKKFDPFLAYKYSKMANILFTFDLAEELRGTGITVNAVHPGVVNTAIYRQITGIQKLFLKIILPFAFTPEKSASYILPLIESEDFAGVSGKFLYKTVPLKIKQKGDLLADRRELRVLSKRLTGLGYL